MKQIKIAILHGSCLCTFYHNGRANVMIIDSVEVDKNHRRKGVGTLLMQKVAELAKKHQVDSVELNVNKDNIPAKKLYEKMGFKKTNKNHYRIILNNK